MNYVKAAEYNKRQTELVVDRMWANIDGEIIGGAIGTCIPIFCAFLLFIYSVAGQGVSAIACLLCIALSVAGYIVYLNMSAEWRIAREACIVAQEQSRNIQSIVNSGANIDAGMIMGSPCMLAEGKRRIDGRLIHTRISKFLGRMFVKEGK